MSSNTEEQPTLPPSGRTFNDNYDHANPSVEYLFENQIFQSDENESHKKLEDDLNFCLTKFCGCQTDDDCADVFNCFHGSNYCFHPLTGEPILNDNRLCEDLIYECSSMCSCPPTCQNRLVQFGPRSGLQIIRINEKLPNEQFGLRTNVDIRRGGFVCEYVGEILTKEEAVRRNNDNEKAGRMNYIICLNELSIFDTGGHNKLQTFIDPSTKGNIGRYLNHSCDPNCEIFSVRVDSIVPKLGNYFIKFNASLDVLSKYFYMFQAFLLEKI